MGIKDYVCKVILIIFRIFPIKKKILFSSFCGKQYSDNPRAIFEEMKKQYSDWKYVWVINDPTIKVEGAKTVKDYSIIMLYHLATSKIWIDNSRKWNWVVKRNKQYYVQTWHGDVCLKKIEKDAEVSLDQNYVKTAIHDSKMADLMISGSKFRTQNYRTSFWYDGEILEKGTPKSDVFYKNPVPIINKVKNFYNIKDETKILLYAPTFRVDSNISCYDLNYNTLLDYLHNTWGGNWVIIIRLHPKIQEKSKILEYDERILNGTCYSSFDELLIASDLMITDYSGTMFHAIEAKKKVVLYASDIDDYMNDRGTYFQIRDLPFPLSRNQKELYDILLNFDDAEYFQKIEKMKFKLGYFNNENSSKVVAQEIIKRGEKK